MELIKLSIFLFNFLNNNGAFLEVVDSVFLQFRKKMYKWIRHFNHS